MSDGTTSGGKGDDDRTNPGLDRIMIDQTTKGAVSVLIRYANDTHRAFEPATVRTLALRLPIPRSSTCRAPVLVVSTVTGPP
jgi:hypothetical protein